MGCVVGVYRFVFLPIDHFALIMFYEILPPSFLSQCPICFLAPFSPLTSHLPPPTSLLTPYLPPPTPHLPPPTSPHLTPPPLCPPPGVARGRRGLRGAPGDRQRCGWVQRLRGARSADRRELLGRRSAVRRARRGRGERRVRGWGMRGRDVRGGRNPRAYVSGPVLVLNAYLSLPLPHSNWLLFSSHFDTHVCIN